MVSDAESMGGLMARGRLRGTFGSARDGRPRQTTGISVDTIPMVRSSTTSFGTGNSPDRQRFLPGRTMHSERICMGDAHITSMERSGGRV
jgi:hypothetical protein